MNINVETFRQSLVALCDQIDAFAERSDRNKLIETLRSICESADKQGAADEETDLIRGVLLLIQGAAPVDIVISM